MSRSSRKSFCLEALTSESQGKYKTCKIKRVNIPFFTQSHQSQLVLKFVFVQLSGILLWDLRLWPWPPPALEECFSPYVSQIKTSIFCLHFPVESWSSFINTAACSPLYEGSELILTSECTTQQLHRLCGFQCARSKSRRGRFLQLSLLI